MRAIPSLAAASAPWLLAAWLGMWMPAQAPAQEFCSEPVMPYCVNQFDDFRSTMRIDRCRDTVNAKLQAVADYRDCANNKADRMSEELSEALEKLQEVRKRFVDESE